MHVLIEVGTRYATQLLVFKKNGSENVMHDFIFPEQINEVTVCATKNKLINIFSVGELGWFSF